MNSLSETLERHSIQVHRKSWGRGRFAALALAAASATTANAAQIGAQDLKVLVDTALQKGLVRVMVNFDDTGGKAIFAKNFVATRAKWSKREAALLTELGSNAILSSYWNNGMGQVGIYVNSKGLNALVNSANAMSMTMDPTTTLRNRAHDLDGSLDEVAALVEKQGFADVELALNHDAGEFDLSRDGKTVFKFTPEFINELKTRVSRLATTEFAKGLTSAASGREPISETLALLDRQTSADIQPTMRARIDHPTFLALREYDGVRGIRPINFVDKRVATWSKEPLAMATEWGVVEVLISLRGGINYTPRMGYLSGLAVKNQTDAHQRTFDDIFAVAGLKVGRVSPATNFGTGILHARLTEAELLRLYAAADPRILSVVANKPMATSQLINSTALLNVPPYWTSGYRGGGQYIAVLDSGIRKAHQFVANKVAYEACYGTNSAGFQSRCLNADQYGDSPLPMPGSGEPPDADFCILVKSKGGTCEHGTHVAGIAAGKAAPAFPASLQGVAPDSSLISVAVHSYKPTGETTIFAVGVLAGLNLVFSATTPNTVSNPLIVNMSFGGGMFANTCTVREDVDLTGVVQDLISRGVPVIAATGNNNGQTGSTGLFGISWPSCIAGVIKVGAVTNDSAGNQVANYTNLGVPANYGSDDLFLLAPGGGNPIGIPLATPSSIGINSADIASNTALKQLSGTSMAAPHVAGLYAMLKSYVASNQALFPNGASVAYLTGFIKATAIPVTAYGQSYVRIRLP